MQTLKLSAIFLLGVSFLLASGCESQLVRDLRMRNDNQQKRIDLLQAEKDALELELAQCQRKLATAESIGNLDIEKLKEQIAALNENITNKDALIDSMQKRLRSGGAALPVELSTLLEDFAKTSSMVSYDSERGIVKFKSDLLFEKGSDQVASTAVSAVQSLCGILNTEEGKNFDVLIAGHTDNIPIQKPATRDKHPTNWHLSVHRAISVLNVMRSNSIDPERMSVRGFGEYRPVAPNAPNNGGNELNRRVEIYIIAKGT
jgi:chemotaxis protein MotB